MTQDKGASDKSDRAVVNGAASASAVPASVPSAGEIERIKQRKYECFMEDHEPLPWTPGRCAGYAGRGSLALHLFRCKRKSGHGLDGLFCHTHAKTGGY